MRFLIVGLLLFITGSVCAQAQMPLRVVVPTMPTILDPHKAQSTVDLAIAGELFTGLVTRNAAGEIVPGLAESWEVSPDGLVYTFSLRRSAAWSDGQRVRARDFVAGFRRALNPETAAPFAGDLFAIQGAEDVRAGRLSPGELGVETLPFRRLRITLVRPSANFLEVLDRPIAMPVSRQAMRGGGEDLGGADDIIVNGAFAANTTNGKLALVKNLNFYGANSIALSRIEFVVARSAAESARLVSNGAADISLGFPFEIEGGPAPAYVRPDKGEGVYFVAANVRESPLNDRGLRHALAMTINREALVRQTALVDAFPAYKMVPPSVLDETLSPRAPYAALRSDMRLPIAEVLLAESNISTKNPKTFTLIYPPGDIHASIARRLAETWAPLGILVLPEEKSTAEYARSLDTGTFDLALTSWPTESSNSMGYLEQFSSNAGPRNITGYADPDFDQSLIAVDSVLDDQLRPSFIAGAEGVLIQDQVIFPIFFFKPHHAVAPRVHGWEANSSGVHPFRYLSLQIPSQPTPVQ